MAEGCVCVRVRVCGRVGMCVLVCAFVCVCLRVALEAFRGIAGVVRQSCIQFLHPLYPGNGVPCRREREVLRHAETRGLCREHRCRRHVCLSAAFYAP